MWSLFLVYAFIMSNYSTLGDVHMLLGTERPLTIEWAFQLKYAGLFFLLLYFINSMWSIRRKYEAKIENL